MFLILIEKLDLLSLLLAKNAFTLDHKNIIGLRFEWVKHFKPINIIGREIYNCFGIKNSLVPNLICFNSSISDMIYHMKG